MIEQLLTVLLWVKLGVFAIATAIFIAVFGRKFLQLFKDTWRRFK